MKKAISILLNDTVFKLVYLCCTLLLMLSVYPRQAGSIVAVGLTVWGLILVVYYFFQGKVLRRDNKLHCFSVALFLLLCGISVVINMRMAFVDNAKTYVTMLLQLVLFYLLTYDRTKVMRETRLFTRVLVAATGLFTLASLVMFFLNIDIMPYGGRFCGLFINPNSGAIMCSISFALSVCCLMAKGKQLKFKKMHIANIVMQNIMIMFCFSRAAIVFVFTFLFMAALYYLYVRIIKKEKFLKNIAALVLVAVLIPVYMVAVPYITDGLSEVSYGIATVKQSVISLFESSNDEGNPPVSKEGMIAIKRDEDNSEQSNSYRMELIKAGIKQIQLRPLFGVAPRNVAEVLVANNPHTYLQGIHGGGVHNIYLQLLVGVGLLGFASFVFLAALFALRAGKLIFNRRKIDEPKKQALLGICFLVPFLAYNLFEANLVFSSSIVAVSFWLALGITTYWMGVVLKKNNELETKEFSHEQ